VTDDNSGELAHFRPYVIRNHNTHTHNHQNTERRNVQNRPNLIQGVIMNNNGELVGFIGRNQVPSPPETSENINNPSEAHQTENPSTPIENILFPLLFSDIPNIQDIISLSLENSGPQGPPPASEEEIAKCEEIPSPSNQT
jgi:hypothetical protein